MATDFLPSGVSAYAVIPFIVIVVVSLVFAALFMRYYWKSRERDRPTAIIATLGLWVALLSSFLLPLDVFLVSYMKTDDGHFKEWATNGTRTSVENGMTYAYYAVYAVILLFVVFLLPLVYFAHEEQDSEQLHPSKRFVSALKYTIVFLFACGLLFVVGVFIPYQSSISVHDHNSTNWDAISQIFSRISDDRGAAAFSFVLNCLVMIGMMTLLLYCAAGLSIFPVFSLRGYQSMKVEEQLISERREVISRHIAKLQARENNLSSRERTKLAELEEEQQLNSRMENAFRTQSQSYWHKLQYVLRSCDIVVGIVGIALGFLIWLSLLLSNIDRVINSLGYKVGYLTSEPKILNLLNYVMVNCQKVFPLDYIFFFGIIVFLVSCTVAGVRHMGIRCLCLKLYKIRPHRTQPQALILLCVILMFTVLAFNILLYSVLPQYIAYGSQHYRLENATTRIAEVHWCNNRAPKDVCLMSRSSTFVLNLMIRVWFFGAVYFWMTWAFLVVVILGFFGALIVKKRSVISEAVDKDDFEESDSDVQPLLT